MVLHCVKGPLLAKKKFHIIFLKLLNKLMTDSEKIGLEMAN